MHPLEVLASSLIGADWQDHSKCLNHLADEDGDHPYDLALKKYRADERDDLATNLCDGCLVTRECAQYALAIRAEGVVMAGVWIGPSNTSYTQRATTRRLRTIAKTPA